MSPLTNDQLEMLQRARDGVPMWGGSTAIPRLARDVDLLLALGLVAPSHDSPCRLTELGRQALASLRPQPTPSV